LTPVSGVHYRRNLLPENATVSSPKAPPEIDRTVSEIGAKLAKARAERGWSLAQLAQRAGLSTAAVHKIEKNGMTPTIASLMKIASALGKSVGYFVEESDAARPVTMIRRDERSRLFTSKQGLVLENISGRYGPFWVAGAEASVEPLADSGPVAMTHPGEELVLVLEGRMRFVIDDEQYDLEAGDSLHFRTVRPHSWANPSDQPARAIWLAIRGS
jgi:transcriptional regulator with XRE-family HTH domain